MRRSNLRKQIAISAARLMYAREEKEYYSAKRKAAARLGVRADRNPQQLPSNREIRDEVQALARVYEGDDRAKRLGEMRLAALRMMRMMRAFEPQLIGSVLTGHVREGSDIDLHVFSDNVSAIEHALDQHNLRYTVERKRVIKHDEERHFTHIHVYGENEFELTMYPREKVNYPFRSSITGTTMERATIENLEAVMRREHPTVTLDEDADETAAGVDNFLIWDLLLHALDGVKQNPQHHPEGDALYHSLQAFELARDEYPYDEELITAALLHDVGKAIDPHDHVAAGLDALSGTLTEREEYLIRYHMDALALRDGTLPQKRRQSLQAGEWYEDLVGLRSIDDRARVPGREVCTIAEAIEFLRAFGQDDEILRELR